MAKVDFLLIGAMKAGTTTLVDYLRRHPQIYLSSVKEIQYFSRDEKYKRGQEWYESFFSDANPNQIRGEGSTCYSRWPHYPHAAERIHAYCPGVKLIYVVREPVARTYSHYRHSYLAKEMSYPTFREALINDDELINSSLYMSQAKQYLEYFDLDQFHFIKFEDIVRGNRESFKNLCEFLSIDNVDLVGEERLTSNKAGFVHARAHMIKLIKMAKYVPGLSHLVKSRFSEQQRKKIIQNFANSLTNTPIGRMISKKKALLVPEMLPEDQTLIRKLCTEDLIEFEKISKLDLRQWYEYNV